jgi:hypothetical protein
VQISPQLYKTEHAVYYIPDAAQVTFPTYTSVMSIANIDNIYLPQLQSAFPDDYMMVAIAANGLSPNTVPSVITRRHLADGIGDTTITGVGVANLCRCPLGGGAVTAGALGVFDHEIGHNWSARLGSEVAAGHWYANGTVHGQMADNTYVVEDGVVIAQQINGDAVNGFTWIGINNTTRNETDTFSDQDLYLMGLHPTYPDSYVLTNPVFNADHTVSSSAVQKYDHAWMLGKNGARTPSYRTSDKQFRLGFMYIARSLTEIQDAYLYWELSIAHFENAEAFEPSRVGPQVPFLVATKYRASVRARLADLDGNATPTLSLGSPSYLTSANGTAVLRFTAADADGAAPTVSLVPSWPHATTGSGTLVLQGLAAGTHFFTLKAEDALGKKAFTHFVVDVTGVTDVPIFTDDPLVAGETTIKAVHLTELRSSIDIVRVRRGLSAYVWSPATITAGATLITAADVTQLRTALSEAYVAAGRATPTFTTLTAGASLVTAASITELRTAIATIWQ